MTLVEKMAIAIGREIWGGRVMPQGKWADAARAARDVMLAEMREPTAAMWGAGDELSYAQQWGLTPHQIQSLWRAMFAQWEKEQAGG